MGILDEAIREHLELKRQHGAGDSELKRIENEAFGPADRPGAEAPPEALAEAPTEFLAQPETAEPEGPKDGEPRSRREGTAVADLQEAPEPALVEPQPELEPAAETDAEAAAHSTVEREAIAEQPTEMYDVEGELAGAAPSPSDEELIEEEEVSEPRLGPTDSLAGLEKGDEVEVSAEGRAPEEDEDDEFWNEQRLSDELDQALEAPLEDEEDEAQPIGEEDEAYEPEPSGQHEASPEPGHGEDLLDETPDFLEETPEDDELWFEQKPPKDFDLDD